MMTTEIIELTAMKKTIYITSKQVCTFAKTVKGQEVQKAMQRSNQENKEFDMIKCINLTYDSINIAIHKD